MGGPGIEVSLWNFKNRVLSRSPAFGLYLIAVPGNLLVVSCIVYSEGKETSYNNLVWKV